MVFFTFPEDARWNASLEAVEFSVILCPYEGTVRIGRRVFQNLLDQSPTGTLCRGVLSPAHSVRDDRRAQAAASATDRRR
jgi:hypothetical protein